MRHQFDVVFKIAALEVVARLAQRLIKQTAVQTQTDRLFTLNLHGHGQLGRPHDLPIIKLMQDAFHVL